MARKMKLSQTAVTRISRSFGKQRHRQETFELSSDLLFAARYWIRHYLHWHPSARWRRIHRDDRGLPAHARRAHHKGD